MEIFSKENGLIGLWKSRHLRFREKLLRTPLRLIPATAQVPVLSGVNKGKRWIVGSGIHSCWVGNYEREKQLLVRKTLAPGMCVWDVGANVGFYTLAFAGCVGVAGEVVAFEPLAENVAFLREHLRVNKIGNVSLVQAAVSRRSSLISFSNAAGKSVGKIESTPTSYRIPAMTLDDYAASARKPDLIKIDVEGAEAAVLEGGMNLLGAHRPELWIALHGDEAKKEVAELLRRLKYRTFGLDERAMEHPYPGDEIVAR